MKTIIGKLVSSLALALLLGTNAHASIYTFVNSGYNPTGSEYFDTFVTTTNVTTVTGSSVVNNYSNTYYGGFAVAVTEIGVGTVMNFGGTVPPTYLTTGSGSAANQTAGSYTLTESCGGAPNSVYANLSITLSW
jgi:hypothetical protein